MIKLPRSLTIGGRRIRLRVVELADEFGQYWHDNGLIEVGKSVTDRITLRDTLRHEMMEAALCISGVGFGERYDQEQVVRCMEQVFFPAWDKIAKLFDT